MAAHIAGVILMSFFNPLPERFDSAATVRRLRLRIARDGSFETTVME